MKENCSIEFLVKTLDVKKIFDKYLRLLKIIYDTIK